jgi:hypothetical protein
MEIYKLAGGLASADHDLVVALPEDPPQVLEVCLANHRYQLCVCEVDLHVNQVVGLERVSPETFVC